MAEAIREFRGEHRWLSNFWYARVRFEGQSFPTVEHAYVAAKTTDPAQRAHIAAIDKPGHVKRYGRNLQLRPDWEGIKMSVMLGLLRQKFAPGTELGRRLELTGDALIEEGNTWGDIFWGVHRPNQAAGEPWAQPRGSNMLGKLIMQVRWENRQTGI